MYRRIALAVCTLLLAAPAGASSFQIYEASGGPGTTALFAPGADTADIDFDASSAEGGSLLFGASEIEIRPFGDVSLVAFVCQLAGCTEGVDYVFTPGDAGADGKLIVSDPDFNEKFGVFDLGLVDWSGLSGGLQLVGCNYNDANAVERTCDPFTLVQIVPEPGTGALLGLGIAALGVARRRRQA